MFFLPALKSDSSSLLDVWYSYGSQIDKLTGSHMCRNMLEAILAAAGWDLFCNFIEIFSFLETTMWIHASSSVNTK